MYSNGNIDGHTSVTMKHEELKMISLQQQTIVINCGEHKIYRIPYVKSNQF